MAAVKAHNHCFSVACYNALYMPGSDKVGVKAHTHSAACIASRTAVYVHGADKVSVNAHTHSAVSSFLHCMLCACMVLT